MRVVIRCDSSRSRASPIHDRNPITQSRLDHRRTLTRIADAALAALRARGADRRSHRVEPDAGRPAVSRRSAGAARRSARAALRARSRCGLASAREAVAADYARRGATRRSRARRADREHERGVQLAVQAAVRPGDAVLVPRPSYPLFEHLTRLEGVRADAVRPRVSRPLGDRLRVAGRGAAGRRAPCSSCRRTTRPARIVSARELRAAAALCRERGWALIADEVFADYPLDARDPVTDIAARARRAVVHARRPVEVARPAAAEARLDGRRRPPASATRRWRRSS